MHAGPRTIALLEALRAGLVLLVLALVDSVIALAMGTDRAVWFAHQPTYAQIADHISTERRKFSMA